MRELILFRTHVFDDATQRFYEYLKATSNRDIVIVAEESRGPLNVGQGRAKISLTRDYASSMGLYAPNNFGWLCGDYFIYAGIENFSKYDRYWLIEYDVRMSYERSAVFFDEFLTSSADVLAFQVRKATDSWFWHHPMAYFNTDVYACNFSFLAISKRAAFAALEKRREMSRCYSDIVPIDFPRKWANDESFLASTTVAEGLNLTGFNTEGKIYATNASFKEGVPLSDRRISEQAEDFLVYHPVHAGKMFNNKVDGWISHFKQRNISADRAREIFNDQLRSDLLTECGDTAQSIFDASIEAWIIDIEQTAHS